MNGDLVLISANETDLPPNLKANIIRKDGVAVEQRGVQSLHCRYAAASQTRESFFGSKAGASAAGDLVERSIFPQLYLRSGITTDWSAVEVAVDPPRASCCS